MVLQSAFSSIYHLGTLAREAGCRGHAGLALQSLCSRCFSTRDVHPRKTFTYWWMKLLAWQKLKESNQRTVHEHFTMRIHNAIVFKSCCLWDIWLRRHSIVCNFLQSSRQLQTSTCGKLAGIKSECNRRSHTHQRGSPLPRLLLRSLMRRGWRRWRVLHSTRHLEKLHGDNEFRIIIFLAH